MKKMINVKPILNIINYAFTQNIYLTSTPLIVSLKVNICLNHFRGKRKTLQVLNLFQISFLLHNSHELSIFLCHLIFFGISSVKINTFPDLA